MSSRPKFWIALIAINLAVWFIVFWPRPVADARPSEQAAPKIAAISKPKPVPSIVVRTNAFDWRQLESEDYRTYINRLRSIGCPEETIRDIVIADLEKLMAPELRDAAGNREPPRYWEPKKLVRTLEALETSGKKQDVDFRKAEIIRELLGIDLAAERSRAKGEVDFYEERLGFLSSEKQTRVRIAMEKAKRAENFLRESSWLENDELTSEERNQLREIQRAKEAEVAQTLTPEELDQYNLWFSPSAYRVRDSFLALEPNEQDFLALYAIQREFDQRWDGVDPNSLTGPERNEYFEAQRTYDGRIQEHLGPERYEKFLQTREPDFHQLQDTITQFALRPEITSDIYGFKKVLTEERSNIIANQNLALEQKQEILKALSDETERAVVEVMGPRAYRYYLRSGAGKWIWE